ncbi:hypothetical protein BN871_AT_00850 [Paenibacillus sp. P22]|nr:hypothetical protein BN871_AT_00850 [Paenibacillus sp. P22]
MLEVVRVRVGVGAELPSGKTLDSCADNEGPYRPKTFSGESWEIVEERVGEFVINLL